MTEKLAAALKAEHEGVVIRHNELGRILKAKES
jgi:hypothetical protein